MRTVKYTAVHRITSSTGLASLGWILGYGFTQKTFTVKSKKWCVMLDQTLIAVCRGKAIAENIANALNKE